MHDESNRVATSQRRHPYCSRFRTSTLTTSVMPPRGQRSTQKPTFAWAASTSARAARSPPAVSSSYRFSLRFDSVPGLYTARPAATFTKKPRPSSSYVHTVLYGLPRHKKSPGWGGWGTRTSRGSVRVDYMACGKPPTDSKRAGAMRNFGEHHQGEVRRISLPRTRVN